MAPTPTTLIQTTTEAARIGSKITPVYGIAIGVGILLGVLAIILITWKCCCTHSLKESKKKDLNLKDLKTFDSRKNERQGDGMTAVDF